MNTEPQPFSAGQSLLKCVLIRIKHLVLLTRNQPGRAKVSDFICGVGK